MKYFISLFLSSSLLFASTPLDSVQGYDYKKQNDVNISLKKTETYVVAFLSAKCPCSASHEKPLKDLAAQYPKIQFIGIHANQDESLQEGERKFKDFPFSVVQDKDAKMANQIGALKTPHIFVVKNGAIVYQGGVDDSTDASRAKKFHLKAALEEISQGKDPSFKEGKALGCFITRK